MAGLQRNHLRNRVFSPIVAVFRTAGLLAVGLLAVVAAAEQPTETDEYILDGEIFANKEAAELVRQAKRHCVSSAGTGEAPDRDKAVALYERAIAAQPGAAINAVLAERIAQNCLFGGSGDVKSDFPKALKWFRYAAEHAEPTDFTFATAHMGLGCSLFVHRQGRKAVEAFNGICEIDPQKIQPPPWRVGPDESTPEGRAEIEAQRQKLLDEAEGIRIRAVEKVFYTASRLGNRRIAAREMMNLIVKYEGTAMAKRAGELFKQASRTTIDKPPEELPEEFFTEAESADDSSKRPSGALVKPTVSKQAASPAVTNHSVGSSLITTGLVILAVCLIVVLLLFPRLRRRAAAAAAQSLAPGENRL